MIKKTAAISTEPEALLPGHAEQLRTLLPWVLLAVVTLLTYANAWPNALLFDDKLFADYERFSDFAAIPKYFSEDAWAAKDTGVGLYRPLLFVFITLDVNLFKDWFAGYHLVNILLHVVMTLVVYAFFIRIFERDKRVSDSGNYIAFLAALIFGIHTMHTEVVNSIFNRSIILAAIGSFTGLWWLLRYLDSRPVMAWAGLSVAYLFALFCRETAIVLPGLAVVLVFVHSDAGLAARIRKCLPALILLIPMVFYLVMRDRALSTDEFGVRQTETSISTVVAQVDSSRLLQGKMLLDVAGTWVQALGLLMWPFEPKLYYADLPDYQRAGGVLIHLGLILFALFRFSRGHKGLITGLAFFYIAMLPSSRLFGTGSYTPHLYERYLYMPSIGIILLLAYALSYLNKRFDPKMATAPVLLALLLLTPVTWARNNQWSDEITLFESDYNRGAKTSYVLRLLTAAHLRAENFDRVAEICEERRAEQQIYGKFSTHCASAFSYLGRLEEAEQAYLVGTRGKESSRLAHSNLAQHYLRQGRWDDAKIQFEEAIEVTRDPAMKEHFTGIMLVYLYPSNRQRLLEARGHFMEALRLHPGLTVAQSWLDRLNQFLGPVSDNQ